MCGTTAFLCLSITTAGLGANPAPSAESVLRRETRVFDIQFLTEKIPDFPLRIPKFAGGGLLVTSPDEEVEVGEFGGLAFGAAEEESADETAAPRWTRIDPKDLVELIRRNIAEDSWANKRNSIQADQRTLTVHQTPDVLDEIERLLATLRARRARMASIEIAIVPAEALDEATRGGSPFLSAERFEQVLARAGDRGKRLSFTAYDGQTVSRHVGSKRTMLRDCEVNQTGVSPVVNPVVVVVPLGYLAEMRADAIADTEWISLRLRAIQLALAGEPETREGTFGQYEFVPIAERSLSTSTIVRAGQAVLAGFLRGEGEAIGSLATLARVRPVPLAAQGGAREQPAAGLRAGIYDIEFLLRVTRAISAGTADWPATPQAAERFIRARVEPESWNDARVEIEADAQRLTVYHRSEVHDAIAALLDRWRRDVLAIASIETWILRGKRGALRRLIREAGPDGELPEKWTDLASGLGFRIVAHARLAGVPGVEMRGSGLVTRGYVADYEWVSGGTAWTLKHMPDPITLTAGSGIDFTCNLNIHRGGIAGVGMRSTHASTDFTRTGTVNLPWDMRESPAIRPMPRGSAPQAAEEDPRAAIPPPPGMGTLTVFIPAQIDLPAQEAWIFDRKLRFPVDLPVLIEARSDGKGDEPATARIALVRIWQGTE